MKNPYIYNLNDYKSLSDMKPIIDYIQLFTDRVPLSWKTAIEDCDNRLDFDGEKYEMKDTKNMYIFFLNSGERISITKKGSSAKIHIPSKAIEFLELKNCVRYIREWVKCIQPLKPYVIDSREYPQKMSILDWKLSRIDLCVNIANDLDLANLQFKTDQKLSKRNWYVSQSYKEDGLIKYKEVLSGVGLGQRKKDSLYLQIYKKWLDPNNLHDLQKYKTTSFTRLEYTNMRKQIKGIPNHNLDNRNEIDVNQIGNNLNMNSLNELSYGNCIALWKYDVQTRYPKFKQNESPVKCIKPMKAHETTGIRLHTLRYQRILGMLSNYRLEMPNYYLNCKKIIDGIFKRQGCLTIKDKIDKYNQKGLI